MERFTALTATSRDRDPECRYGARAVRTKRLRISMRDVSPAVVRVIDVPPTVSLPELHELFQVALGWTNSNLHHPARSCGQM